jgi:hypothetical protein
MPLTLDRFKKTFTKSVSTDLLDNRKRKVDEAIAKLELAVAALKTAGIDAQGYEDHVAPLKAQCARAVGTGTTEDKYKALDAIKERARVHAASAEKALKLEPSKKQVEGLKAVISQSGTGAIDARIAKLGGKAGSDSEKQLVVAAIKARWGLEKLNGELSTKALPRLYTVMTMVPEDHIKGNEKLKEIRRDRNPEPGEASFYRGSDDLIVLNLGKTGSWHDPNCTVTDENGTTREVSYFDHTTLHEIGHAVDAKLKFMDSKGATATYGGWAKETPAKIAAKAGAQKGFFAAFPHPPALLTNFLSAILEQGKPDLAKGAWLKAKQLNDSGVTKQELLDDPGLQYAEAQRLLFEADAWADTGAQADAFNAARGRIALKAMKALAAREVLKSVLDHHKPLADAVDAAMAGLAASIPGDDEWNRMAAHPAAAWCNTIRMNGSSSGLWEGGKGAAASAALPDGRVYQQSYKSEWSSYALSARTGGISSYQFRASGECRSSGPRPCPARSAPSPSSSRWRTA